MRRALNFRSPYDREILRLALPALGALAAEPLYVLVDTAIVGHLGRPQLAALGLAGTVLGTAFTLFNFLDLRDDGGRCTGERCRPARARGAAGCPGPLGLARDRNVIADPLRSDSLAAAPRPRRARALRRPCCPYFQIAAIGLPAALVALAGTGYLRGVSNLRRPLEIVVAANIVNLALELLFVYGFDWGVAGSAAGTAIAQLGMGVAFVVELLRPPAESRRPRLAEMRPLLRVGRQIFVRTAALLGSFLVAASVLARIGDVPLAAHQIAFELYVFLALVLDAVAIAGQVIVGRMLGGADAIGANAAALRMIAWATALGGVFMIGLLVLEPWLPALFTNDPAVLDAAAVDLGPLRTDAAARRSGFRARRDPHRRGRHVVPDVVDACGRAGRVPADRRRLTVGRVWDRRRLGRASTR